MLKGCHHNRARESVGRASRPSLAEGQVLAWLSFALGLFFGKAPQAYSYSLLEDRLHNRPRRGSGRAGNGLVPLLFIGLRAICFCVPGLYLCFLGHGLLVCQLYEQVLFRPSLAANLFDAILELANLRLDFVYA